MYLATDNPTTEVTENQSIEPAATETGTGATDGQAQRSETQGGAPAEIFQGIDPNTLTPKEKALYNSMLTDYRTKTAKLSETIKTESAKAAEAFKSKAELYEQIASQEAFVKQWNEYVEKSQSPQNGQQNGNADPVLRQMEAKLNEMSQKMQLSETSQVTDAFADAKDEKGQKLHPDFDSLNSISIGQINNGGKAEDFSLLRACVELSQGNNPAEKLANGYKMAKAAHSSIFEQGKKAGMGRIQSKIQNGSQAPSLSSGDTLTVTEKKPKSAREALDMAKRGMVVSRD